MTETYFLVARHKKRWAVMQDKGNPVCSPDRNYCIDYQQKHRGIGTLIRIGPNDDLRAALARLNEATPNAPLP